MSARFPDEMSAEELSAYRRAAKEALRKRLAALRRTVTSEARAERSSRACARLVAEPAFASARVVLGYAALRFELDPAPALTSALASGKLVALPRVIPDSGELSLHVYAPGDELQESGFGVREPSASAAQISAAQVDLVLVPGLSFDARGYRLGYGKGFYDRLLPSLVHARRIGLAFELSLLPELPNEAHDIPMHAIVTEKRAIALELGAR